MPDPSAVFEAWRQKADEDLTAAEILLAHDGPPATICFLCQQTAEKYLKGYLFLHHQPLRRIHQLDALLEDCVRLDGSFTELVEDAVLLKSYYIGSRYPDDLPESFERDEAASAVRSAKRVAGFVRRKALRK